MGKRKEIIPPIPPYTIKEYEASPYWKKKSKILLDDKEVQCAICKRHRWKKMVRSGAWRRKYRFAVHHITYINIPDEKPEDLMILCYQCHELCHTILRLEHLGEFYRKLVAIVKEYFQYDAETHKPKEADNVQD